MRSNEAMISVVVFMLVMMLLSLLIVWLYKKLLSPIRKYEGFTGFPAVYKLILVAAFIVPLYSMYYTDDHLLNAMMHHVDFDIHIAASLSCIVVLDYVSYLMAKQRWKVIIGVPYLNLMLFSYFVMLTSLAK